ncbi:MAG: DUF4115 domain-containing protein [Sphingopyxis sp.]|nr:DUF4115 domain-containing protein [Sphingopyxis sp.]
MFVGLFTLSAYARSTENIPLLRQKVRRIAESTGFLPDGHDGKTLFSKLNAAGSEQTVEGRPPFAIVVGNASGVRLRFNERQEQEIRAWLAPEQRDWILVGLAESTTMHRDLEAALEPPDLVDGYLERQPARVLRQRSNQGLDALDDRPRHGARPTARRGAPVRHDRARSLLHALRRRDRAALRGREHREAVPQARARQFAALFGDYETGLTVTELSRRAKYLIMALERRKRRHASRHDGPLHHRSSGRRRARAGGVSSGREPASRA